MGVLDDSYKFFVASGLDAALCYKVKNHVCLVGGDPLCPEELVSGLLEEFKRFRAKHNWGLIFIGARYATPSVTTVVTVRFFRERYSKEDFS